MSETTECPNCSKQMNLVSVDDDGAETWHCWHCGKRFVREFRELRGEE